MQESPIVSRILSRKWLVKADPRQAAPPQAGRQLSLGLPSNRRTSTHPQGSIPEGRRHSTPAPRRHCLRLWSGKYATYAPAPPPSHPSNWKSSSSRRLWPRRKPSLAVPAVPPRSPLGQPTVRAQRRSLLLRPRKATLRLIWMTGSTPCSSPMAVPPRANP
jgi:hypothetical protein